MRNIGFKSNKLSILLICTMGGFCFADDFADFTADVQNNNVNVGDVSNEQLQLLKDINANSYYINQLSYNQNPFNGIVSGGGTQSISENDLESYTFARKLFSTGTYNLYGGAVTTLGSEKGVLSNGLVNGSSAYGLNGYVQSGTVGGFSVGAAATVMNPFFDGQMNGSNVNSGLLTPTNTQMALTQAFLEYQHSNVVSADVGYIAINNSPWLSGNFSNDTVNIPITYQGLLVNVYPGNGWLLTGLAFNGVQTSGQENFTGTTLLNNAYGLSYVENNAASSGTIALGSDYKAWKNNYDLRIWAYQFNNYGTLLYADNALNIPLAETVKFNFAAQVGNDNNWGSETAYSGTVNNPNINSNFIGGQAGVTIDWFNLTFSANSIWGDSSSLGNGAIVSPYTSHLGADPLYSEGFLTNIVDMGLTGNMYKASASLSFLDNNLSISPSYVTLGNANPYWDGTNEAYLVVNYSIPEIKGLHVLGAYAYQWLPVANPLGSQWSTEFLASYLW